MSSLLKPSKVLIDTNVWLGYLVGKEPICSEIKAMLEACVHHEVELFYAPTTLKDLFYLLPRILKQQASATLGVPDDNVSFIPAAWACVRLVADLATAAPLTSVECELSWTLRETHGDLEDNLVIAAAETCGATYLVTYDKGLSRHYAPACIQPAELTHLLEQSQKLRAPRRA